MSTNCLISRPVIISEISTESGSANLSNAATTFAVAIVPSEPPENEVEYGVSIFVYVAVVSASPQFKPPQVDDLSTKS